MKRIADMAALSCKAATRLASDRMERRLTWGERIGLGFHKAMCLFCRRWVAQTELLHQAVRAYDQAVERHLDSDGPRLSPEAREHIKAALRASHE